MTSQCPGWGTPTISCSAALEPAAFTPPSTASQIATSFKKKNKKKKNGNNHSQTSQSKKYIYIKKISPPSAPPLLCVASLDSCNAVLAALLAATALAHPRLRSPAVSTRLHSCRKESAAVRPEMEHNRCRRFSLNRSLLRPKGGAAH